LARTLFLFSIIFSSRDCRLALFILTRKLSILYRDLPAFVKTTAVKAKIAPWCLASRDSLLAKEPGPVTGWTAPPTLSAHTRNRWV